MSTPFYDLASLVVVPSGVKAAKVYAQKPMTTDGQLAFSRASTATRVNASGLIETVASNVPRLDYLGSTCPKLLLEPSRTNYVADSSTGGFGSADVASLTAQTKAGISGYARSDAGGGNPRIFLNLPSAVGFNVFTLYVDTSTLNTTTDIRLGVDGNASTGIGAGFNKTTLTFGSITVYNPSNIVAGSQFTKVERLSGTIYRLTMGANFTSLTNVFPVIYFQAGASGAWIGGAQVERASYPTSLIVTTTAAVTRLADACSKTGISSLIGQTEGVLFVDFVPNNTPVSVSQWLMFLGTGGNYISIYISNQKLLGNVAVTTDQCAMFTSYNLVGGTRYKAALAYKENDFAFYVNGVQIGVDTSGTVPAVSTLQNNYNTTAANSSNAGLNQALLFKTRLTNAQLAELTTL